MPMSGYRNPIMARQMTLWWLMTLGKADMDSFVMPTLLVMLLLSLGRMENIRETDWHLRLIT